MSWLWVATGGALGSCMRYGLSVLTVAAVGDGRSVLGTFFANVLGSFGLGLVMMLAEARGLESSSLRLFWGAGMMGGFTTYSTFNLQTLRLAESGQWTRAAVYVVSTLLVCLLAGALGLWAGRQLQ